MVAMAEAEERYCSVAGCERPEEAAGLCFGHRYRAKHGLPLSPPLKERLPPFERVIEAMKAFFDAEEDDDYRRAKARLRAACWDWLLPHGPRRRRHRLPRRRES